MCVNNLPGDALDSGEAGIRTRDLLIASPASQPLGHRATLRGLGKTITDNIKILFAVRC